MSGRGVEIKVGALLIIAVIVLFAGYTWYSGYRVGKAGYDVKVNFPDVTGLLPGDDVRVAGVKKGKVKAIALKGKVVEVTLWLDNEVELFEDATFSIMDVALISGTKYVAVVPGTTSVALDLSEPAIGRPSAAFALSSVADLSESLDDLVGVIRTNLLTEDALVETRETVQNLNALTKELVKFFSENRRNLSSGVRAFKSASAKLDSIVGSEEFMSTVARLDTLTQKLNSGEGSLAKLLNDPGAYDEMKGTLKAAKELLEDIKAHPKKYINVEIF